MSENSNNPTFEEENLVSLIMLIRIANLLYHSTTAINISSPKTNGYPLVVVYQTDDRFNQHLL
jgi:hypothetical protein